jgi:hypothetical protein
MRLAVPVVLALQLAAPLGAQAGETGVLAGRVLPPAEGGPKARAVWIEGNPTPVSADGSFRAAGVAGGPTHLAIETSEGLYVVDTPVTIVPGATRSIDLALGGREDTSAPPPAGKEKKKKQGGFWANPVYATLIIIGSAIVVGVAVDQLTQSKSNPASPSSP